ncbi:YkvA family protein [Peribacillus simplex]|uniref:YkvA family protein n=2 Tax=Peribacillus TaxID=2675229 RepID=A0AA90P6A0_9BACI|nr:MULTISPECIES: YkvA family protein [Peribacillus]MDP1420181.1 YkvA family protein [Peribacillus simplex]MDP1454359.1 YkvA family protein [Peribacillus frigoritolerans]
MFEIKTWTSNLKRQIYILYFACKDERVPLYAKVFTACVVAYAFSPIDLIPDFIPILGYLDDVILVPLGIIIALKMIPKTVLSDCECKAEEMMKNGKPKNWIVGSIIVLIWGLILIWAMIYIYRLLNA